MTTTMTRNRSPGKNRRRRELRYQTAVGCPTPTKHGYPNEETADTALLNLWATPRPGKKYPVRTYHCPCGNWHHTKTTPT